MGNVPAAQGRTGIPLNHKHHTDMLQGKYAANQRMNDIIADNPTLLLAVSRFGLPLGFHNRTVREVCEAHGVDTDTFVTVINFLAERYYGLDNGHAGLRLDCLIGFLRNGHRYFLDFKLPDIRAKLVRAIEANEAGAAYRDVFLRFFDEYVEEVDSHMRYEDEVAFPYVLGLLQGHKPAGYDVHVFEERHNQIDQKMLDLKNILIKYYPSEGNSFLLTDLLIDILGCGAELTGHNRVEDYLLIPAVESLEQSIINAKR